MRRANLFLENVKIGFRNFEGREGRYNAEGKRNFVIFLDNETAARLEEQGWNIHWPKPNENDTENEKNPFLKVRVNFNWKGLKIVMIVNGKPEFLDEDTVGVLDTAELENVDVSVSPYEYEPGKISASLASIYATVKTDEFMAKYGY